MGKLLEEVLDHTLVVIAPAKDVVERGEAMRLTGFLLMVKLLRFEFVISDYTPVVARCVHRETRSKRSVHADDHRVLAGAAVPRKVITFHKIDHLPEPRVGVDHLVPSVSVFPSATESCLRQPANHLL